MKQLLKWQAIEYIPDAEETLHDPLQERNVLKSLIQDLSKTIENPKAGVKCTFLNADVERLKEKMETIESRIMVYKTLGNELYCLLR